MVISNTLKKLYLISGFRREGDENCILLGYYAASIGNFLPTFRDNLSVPKVGTDMFSRNFGKDLTLLAA
jgi:hypothetical protein